MMAVGKEKRKQDHTGRTTTSAAVYNRHRDRN